MRKTRLFLTAAASFPVLFLALLLSGQAQAQSISSYQLSKIPGTYNILSGDSSLTDGGSFDDNDYQVQIGFPFQFANRTFGTVHVSSNGFVKLGPNFISGNSSGTAFVSASNYRGTILDNTGGDNYLLSILNMDLKGRAGDAQISISRSGNAPNRRLTIQWYDVSRFSTTADFDTKDTLNFQMALVEDGSVEYTYGPMAVSNQQPRGAQVGIRGQGRNQVLTARGTGFVSAFQGSTSTDTVAFNRNAKPPVGFMYIFSPPTPAPINGAALAIAVATSPRSGCQLSNQEPVGVRVRNNGSDSLRQATVGLTVNGVTHTQVVTFTPPLAPREEKVVVFSGANGADLSQFISYSIKAFIVVQNDTIHADDSTSTGFRLRAPTPVPSQTAVTSLDDAHAKGWIESDSGLVFPTDSTTGVWESDTFDYPGTIARFVSGFSNVAYPVWLTKPAIKSTQAISMRFKLAVSAGFSGDNVTAAIVDDDSLKIVYTDDCGITWKTLMHFTKADITAERINNELKTFIVSLGANPGTFSIAFQVKDNGTFSDISSYRWHLDDIEFLNSTDINQDLTALHLAPVANPLSGCSLTTQEGIKVNIQNVGLQPVSATSIGLIVDGTLVPPTAITLTPPLATGDSRIITVTGANLSQFGVHTIKAFVQTTGDGYHINDTVSSTINLPSPISIPGPPVVTSLSQATAQGWVQAEGDVAAPADTSSGVWQAEGFDYPNTIYYYVDDFGTIPQSVWLYRPGLRASDITGIRFKLAVSAGFSSDPTTSLGDDTLKVVYSDDCGITWKTAARFSKADVTSGRIDNTLKSFLVPFATGPGNYSIGFEIITKGTLATNVYRWHLDDLEFVSNINVATETALQPAIPANQNLGSCPSHVLPISVVVSNQGITTLDTVVLGYRYNNGPVHTQTFLTSIPATAKDTLTFSPANLVAPNLTGTISLRVFSIKAGDAQASNDTIRVSFVITPSQNATGTSLVGLSSAILAGYTQALTRAQVQPRNNVFSEGTSFGPSAHTVAYTATAANATDGAAWLISPKYKYSIGASLRFTVAVTNGTTGTSSTSNLGSDSLKVLYRMGCDAPWQQLGLFTQANLSPTQLSNRLLGYFFQAPVAGPDSVQFAFEVARGAVGAPNVYRWHISNVSVTDEPLGTRPTLQLPALTLYPVPAHTSLDVAFGASLTNAALKVTDLSGRSLMTAKANGTAATLNIGTLHAGMYLLTVETADGQITRPFVVE